MDTKKLAKIIKLIVEAELKRQLPKLVKEGVQKVLSEQKQFPVAKQPIKEVEEIDPFSLANAMLDEDRETNSTQVENLVNPIKDKKRFTSNKVLNEILNNTQPFNSTQRGTSPVGVDTMNFGTNLAQGGVEALNTVAAGQMGRMVAPIESNAPTTVGLEKRSGLNSNTGLTAFDRIMNRDNSALVKKFKTR